MKTSVWTTPIPVPRLFSGPSSLGISTRKEVRAIMVPLLGAIALGLFAAFAGRDWVGGFVFVLYPLACSAIGSLAFGHDYSNRTLATFLALPVARSKVWWLRLGCSLFAMSSLAVLIIGLLYTPFFYAIKIQPPGSEVIFYTARIVFVPILSGLFMAPWLTLISRSSLFGAIVSLVIPFFLRLASSSVLRAAGQDQPGIPWEPPGLLPMSVLSIIFGILGWRKFKNLEVIDGDVAAFARSTSRATTRIESFRRGSATLQLVKNNFMLLRMPIGLAGFGMLFTFFLKEDQAALWTLIYPAVIVLLIGAISSADERQLGVAEWQTLMPIAFWKQWTIKFSVTWLSAVVAGVILPVVILFLKTNELQKIGSEDFLQAGAVFVVASLGFITITLYISSLCNSGLKALIAAILVNISVAYMMIQFFDAYSNLLWREGIVGSREIMEMLPDGSRVQRTLGVPVEKGDWWNYWQYSPFLLAIVGFAVVAFLLAMRNHRYAERGPGRLLRQVTAFAAYEAAAAIAITTFWNWYSWLR